MTDSTEHLTEVREAYDLYGGAYDTQTEAFHRIVAYPEMERLIRERLPAPAGLRVLDVGCGSGRLVARLCASGIHAEGCELSRAQVARAQANGIPVREGSLLSLPFPDTTVDLIVSYHALNYLQPEQLQVAFREQARILRPGGTVLHACMPAEGPGQLHVPFFGRTLTLYAYPEAVLQDALTSSGFGNIRFQEAFARHVELAEAIDETEDEAGRSILGRFYAQPYALIASATRV